MRNSAVRETQLLGGGLDKVTKLLPRGWRLDVREVASGETCAEVVVNLSGPAGNRVPFVAEVKRSGTMPTQRLLAALRERRQSTGLPVLFVSDYIGPAVRAALVEESVSFVDATGWVRLTNDDPLVLLTGEGAERSPRTPKASAVSRLNGLAVNRTIRELSRTELPIGVRDLASRALVSPGSVSKLLATLATEGIVDRDERGRTTAVRRRALIQRWVQDYGFTKTNETVGYYIAPRGLSRPLDRLAELEGVILTGSAAARQLLPARSTSVVPLRLLALYAAAPATVARELGLIDADPTASNVMIAVPQDTMILQTRRVEGLVIASVAQVLADLLTLPGRSDAEAEQLMDALAAASPAWKE